MFLLTFLDWLEQIGLWYMNQHIRQNDVFGLVRPGIDIHTLGISYLQQLLEDCGVKVVIADELICAAANHPDRAGAFEKLRAWFRDHRVTHLGFSYRLDAKAGAEIFGRLYYQLEKSQLLFPKGSIRNVYFAGLPAACERVARSFGSRVQVFRGDEDASETLKKLGVPREDQPDYLQCELEFESKLFDLLSPEVERQKYEEEKPVDRSGYPGYGTRKDLLTRRVEHSLRLNLQPLTRAHAGPYQANRKAAIEEFVLWLQELGRERFLDIVSIGSSQLTQEKFGEDWTGLPNGGGVPIHSEEEFERCWEAARPLLVRTYAGTSKMPELAEIYERCLSNAWHTFSLWWFCEIDGRGPLDLLSNLKMHFETLDLVARFGKAYEPNIPHHFGFRGADDATFVLSGLLAARLAKKKGLSHLVLQCMLNTPKFSSGLQDLAKASALIRLVRKLEGPSFKVYLQPRAGLDYFSPDLQRAKKQLAVASAMMDDIEPENRSSPEIIHVVSFTEASHLARPSEINESIRITQYALRFYRDFKRKEGLLSLVDMDEVRDRSLEIEAEVLARLSFIESEISEPYSPEGFHQIFSLGLLPVPQLWGSRSKYPGATRFSTRLIQGSVRLVKPDGSRLETQEHLEQVRKIASHSKTL
ncbi:MAG: cobalamin-binding protein [Bradymonadales bacterium]|nr:MAG: cobalamin-binding protein [Bradymonadales bacterium]